MTTLVKSVCWNPADLLIFKSFHQQFIFFDKVCYLKAKRSFLLLPLLWYNEMLPQISTISVVSLATFLAGNLLDQNLDELEN